VKIERIDHVHILVKDLYESARFFSDILGTQFVGPINHGDHEIAFDNAGIELLAATSSKIPEFMERLGMQEGVCAISLKVPDLEEALSELDGKGVKCAWKGGFPGLRCAQLDPKSTHGAWIELVEYDYVPPIALANLGKTDEVPFTKQMTETE
jgi:catechol 2,3-dioxygenase-like lactoylglutathione lyase family enzyme